MNTWNGFQSGIDTTIMRPCTVQHTNIENEKKKKMYEMELPFYMLQVCFVCSTKTVFHWSKDIKNRHLFLICLRFFFSIFFGIKKVNFCGEGKIRLCSVLWDLVDPTRIRITDMQTEQNLMVFYELCSVITGEKKMFVVLFFGLNIF